VFAGRAAPKQSGCNTLAVKRLLVSAALLTVLASACATTDDSTPAGAGADTENQVALSDDISTPTAEPEPTSTPEPPPTATTAPTVTPEPAPACAGVEPGNSTYTLDAGGAVHDVSIFVPSSFDPSAPIPVVLNWHGLGSSGPEQMALTAYQALAEVEGFIAVFPTGIPFPGTTNNSWEVPGFDDPGRDDLAFAEALIDDVVDRFCGDPNRIYSTGMSNGGFFTGLLVCELADRIAAAASVGGISFPDDCAPARAVPLIAFHGTADEVVLFDSSNPDISTDSALVSVVIPEEFGEFAAAIGCNLEPTETPIGSDVIRHDYSGCDNDVPMSFYEVIDGGHTWPGSPLGALLETRLGRTTETISATELAWELFKDQSLPG